MEFIKLQLGCLIVVLYIAFLYLKNKKTNQKSLFDFIIIISIIELFFDGATAYTVILWTI